MRSVRIGNDLTIVGKVVFAKHFSDFWLASEVGQQVVSCIQSYKHPTVRGLSGVPGEHAVVFR